MLGLTIEGRRLLSSILASAIVSFGVAYYTVQRADRSRREDARIARLTAVYEPLRAATADVLTCLRPDACTREELGQTSRMYNLAFLLASGQSSDAVSRATEALDKSLRETFSRRVTERPQPDALLARLASQFVELQARIEADLAP